MLVHELQRLLTENMPLRQALRHLLPPEANFQKARADFGRPLGYKRLQLEEAWKPRFEDDQWGVHAPWSRQGRGDPYSVFDLQLPVGWSKDQPKRWPVSTASRELGLRNPWKWVCQQLLYAVSKRVWHWRTQRRSSWCLLARQRWRC